VTGIFLVGSWANDIQLECFLALTCTNTAPRYYDYTVSNNGVAEKHGNDYALDYFTDRLANRSLEFIRNVTTAKTRVPFFMMIGTPAPHGPNDPAPQYATAYAGMYANSFVYLYVIPC